MGKKKKKGRKKRRDKAKKRAGAKKKAKERSKKKTKEKKKKCPVHCKLEVQEVRFSGNHVVNKDTLADFTRPEWIKGRSANDQSPVCYTRNKKVTISIKFKVTTKPSQTETVKIKGTGVFGGKTLKWECEVNVGPGDNEVEKKDITSNETFPNEVACYDPANITWQMNPANIGWSGAGTSVHLVYVTLGDPNVTPAYWTLLDVSCRKACGQTTERGVVSKIFESFATRNITRKRDNKPLTYWKPDDTKAMQTADLLGRPDGSGQCGSWSEFLIDMYKVHGITKSDKILVDYGTGWGFLVKNWKFNHPPPSKPDYLTHCLYTECVEKAGIPGQNNSDPRPRFYNHFIVRSRVTNEFYDPSYGAGPYKTQNEWEKAAIDGLFSDKHKPDAGYDMSLRGGWPNLLRFWDLTTNKKI